MAFLSQQIHLNLFLGTYNSHEELKKNIDLFISVGGDGTILDATTLIRDSEIPIIGVNTFLNKKGSPTIIPEEIIRATEKEKKYQISMLTELHKGNKNKSDKMLRKVQEAAIQNENIFEILI